MLETGSLFFFFNDTATTEIYTLSLHDALPIFHERVRHRDDLAFLDLGTRRLRNGRGHAVGRARLVGGSPRRGRSEEHTSELQSQSNLVCRLLLEKKMNTRSRTRPRAAALSLSD